jgi:hypothetical protein
VPAAADGNGVHADDVSLVAQQLAGATSRVDAR